MPAQSDAAAIPLATRQYLTILWSAPRSSSTGEQMEAGLSRRSRRVLRPNAWAVISSPNYLNPMGVRKWLNDRRLGESYWDPRGGHPGFELD